MLDEEDGIDELDGAIMELEEAPGAELAAAVDAVLCSADPWVTLVVAAVLDDASADAVFRFALHPASANTIALAAINDVV